MISLTAPATDAAPGTSALSSAAVAAGSAATTSSHCIQTLQESLYLASLQLVGHPVGDQTDRALGDLLADRQPVLPQGRAGGGEVHDPLHQAGKRCQLYRPFDLHDLGLASGLQEV